MAGLPLLLLALNVISAAWRSAAKLPLRLTLPLLIAAAISFSTSGAPGVFANQFSTITVALFNTCSRGPNRSASCCPDRQRPVLDRSAGGDPS